MKRVQVLFDVDDVIADFTGHYLSKAGKKMDRVYSREQVTGWKIAKCLELPSWCEREISYELRQVGAAHLLPELPGSIAAVKHIASFCDVYFVTSPYSGSRTWASDREDWLVNRFGDLGSRVIFTNFKSPIVGDIFVDDKPSNVQHWSNEQPGIPILYDRTHNRFFKEELPIRRLGSWDEIIRLAELKDQHRNTK